MVALGLLGKTIESSQSVAKLTGNASPETASRVYTAAILAKLIPSLVQKLIMTTVSVVKSIGHASRANVNTVFANQIVSLKRIKKTESWDPVVLRIVNAHFPIVNQVYVWVAT